MDDPVTKVADSPELRFTLETARAWGISPSVFMGRTLKQETQYVYGDNGLVVQSITVIESAWTDEDRAMAMELQDYEYGLCPGCGSPRSETTAPENEFSYQAQDPIRCHRCTTAERGMEAHRDKPQASALSVPVVLRGTNNDSQL